MFRAESLLAAVGTFALFGCTRLSESSLTGTWRTETAEVVNEIAFRGEHTFTSWTSAKNALTTPSCPTSAGEWKLKRGKILVHLRTHIAVDGWEPEHEDLDFAVVKVGRDTMQLKGSHEKGPVTYKRLLPDYSVPACTRTPIDRDLFGVWRVHYNTHDYELVFGRDHSFGIFANLPDWRQPAKGDVRQQLWTGTWRILDRNIVINMKNVPSFDGESIETHRRQWPVIGIEGDRVAVQDGPVRYLWQRLN
jgi:hypothetical protein